MYYVEMRMCKKNNIDQVYEQFARARFLRVVSHLVILFGSGRSLHRPLVVLGDAEVAEGSLRQGRVDDEASEGSAALSEHRSVRASATVGAQGHGDGQD